MLTKFDFMTKEEIEEYKKEQEKELEQIVAAASHH